MSNLPLDHKFAVQGGKGFVTMADMVRHAQMMVNSNEEISWTLWFLTHYLEPDAVWTNYNGERWGMEKLVAIQTGQNVTTAPCGGTHGLFALAYARNAYMQKYKLKTTELRGTWLEANQKIEEHIAKAKAWQNRDGSLSAHFFRESGHTVDPTDRLKSSGHMLEWLMMAVPQQQLKENWIRQAVGRVAIDLAEFSNQEIDPGPLFHAAHAITLYRERVSAKQMTPQNPKPLESLANQPPKTTPPPVAQAPKTEAPKVPPKPSIELKPAEPKAVAQAPTNPAPTKPIVVLEPDKRTAMKDDVPSPGPMPKSIPLNTAPAEPQVTDAPRPIPSNQATPIPMPITPPADSKAVVPPPKDDVIALPQLPTPGSQLATKRPPSLLPYDKAIGTSPTPPNPTPIDIEEKPGALPETPVGTLPVPPLPTFELKPIVRSSKPDSSTAEPPKPTKVTSPTPIVLPPLPLDPVDAGAGAGK